MMNRMQVKNFKCFSNLDLELSNLNVLTGVNSMGKSTVIQALLLLRQSYDMGAIARGLILNGEATKIGTGYDLLYRNSDTDEIYIALSTNEEKCEWTYKYEKASDFQQLLSMSLDINNLERLNVFQNTFSYVSAERMGPQRFYEKSYHEVYEKNQVGYRGEHFAEYIAERGFEDKVENVAVRNPNVDSELLIYQLEAWLSEISPGIHLNPKSYSEAGIVSMEFNLQEGEFTPMNVGFGISYVAPIVTSLLKAKPGNLVLIENPEAHLHPKGQRKMGELISLACAGGVQVIVETHSDHLLNGVRLSVKNGNIDRNLVRLNYFYEEMQDKKLFHRKGSPAILPNGSLSDWPEGFFDEWDKAIEDLF